MPHANRLVILLSVAIVALVVATTMLDGAPMWIAFAAIGLMLGLGMSPRLGRRAASGK